MNMYLILVDCKNINQEVKLHFLLVHIQQIRPSKKILENPISKGYL